MLITLKGLVIGQRIIGENSCFLDLFTDKLGMIEVMAHGAKKIGGKNSVPHHFSVMQRSASAAAVKGIRLTVQSRYAASIIYLRILRRSRLRHILPI